MRIRKWWTGLPAALFALGLSALAFAQDPSGGGGSGGGGGDVTSTTTTSTSSTVWYGQWYIWVGVAVFLIIIIALTNRGGSRSS